MIHIQNVSKRPATLAYSLLFSTEITVLCDN